MRGTADDTAQQSQKEIRAFHPCPGTHPKAFTGLSITSNDLAGSKRLYNFFDSVFVIGKSALDGGLRYVKQLKVRYGTFSYDADNVIVYEIEKTDAFLQFVFRAIQPKRNI